MATTAGTAKSEPVGTALLEQLADLDAKGMSPETARAFLAMTFSRTHEARVHALSEKSQEGRLSPDEAAELDEFIRVADLLTILHSKARQALQYAGVAP